PRKTEAIDFGSRPTTPLAPSGEDEYRLAAAQAAAGTHAEQGGSPAGRTELGTQSGKGTGAAFQSSRGTDVERRDNESSAEAAAVSSTSQFIRVSDEERRGPREAEDSPLKQWSLAAALAAMGLAVIGGSIYF